MLLRIGYEFSLQKDRHSYLTTVIDQTMRTSFDSDLKPSHYDPSPSASNGRTHDWRDLIYMIDDDSLILVVRASDATIEFGARFTEDFFFEVVDRIIGIEEPLSPLGKLLFGEGRSQRGGLRELKKALNNDVTPWQSNGKGPVEAACGLVSQLLTEALLQQEVREAVLGRNGTSGQTSQPSEVSTVERRDKYVGLYADLAKRASSKAATREVMVRIGACAVEDFAEIQAEIVTGASNLQDKDVLRRYLNLHYILTSWHKYRSFDELEQEADRQATSSRSEELEQQV
jgi:hypothetical protein